VNTAVRPWAVLATCCLSLFLVSMDVTIVNVALPAIGRDLHASVTGLQWSIDGYTVVIASFLVLAGSMADRLGRRRVFQVGLAVFCAGSLACSFAPTIEILVAFRVVQAIGGAMMNPVAMSIIVNVFTDPKQRAQAIGLWGAVFGISMAIGPPLGGILVQAIGWPAIFWVNVPIGLATIALTRKFVPESRADHPRRIDLVGQVLIVIVLAALTSALIEGPHAGWSSAPIVLAFGLVGIGGAALVAHEHRRPQPLIDLRFFRSVPFSSATIMAVVAFTAMAGTLFLSSLYLQETRGLTPSHAGLCLLPIAGALVVCAPLSGRLIGAGHIRSTLVVAGIALTAAAALLVDLGPDTPLGRIVGAFALLGIGLGLVNPPITNAAVSGMPRRQAGVASALASTSRQIGATLGIALSGTIASARATSPRFAASTRPFWWIVVAAGLAIVALGLVATGAWARRTVAAIAAIVTDEA
jgi:EmrB/QacA subfamily drug resistance transporter